MNQEITEIRAQFPILRAHTPQLTYLDNAATTQQPQSVIQSQTTYYSTYHANVHRSLYEIAHHATTAYEQTRQKLAQFIKARQPEEIVFTSGATQAINLVANSFLGPKLVPGDEIIISAMEHHANLIPWQQICQARGAKLRVIPHNEQGVLELEKYQQILTPSTRLVALVHISNTLGTINPIQKITEMAHQQNIPVLVDATQSLAQKMVDVQELGCDFLVGSGHKMFGPTGTGFLYGKAAILKTMPPNQFGGDMVKRVTFEETTFANPPHRFEAGTPNISGFIGLGAAIDFLNQLDTNWLNNHLESLKNKLLMSLSSIQGLKLFGPSINRSGIFSFSLGDIHPHDLATFLSQNNICIRAGHHCTQPIMQFYGVPAMARVSLSIYNTEEEIDFLVEQLEAAKMFFGY